MGLLSTIGAASGRAFGLTRVGAAIRDAYFNLTTLLLPGNGTNGAQNNTFLDSSSNNFTITRNGNTTQGTFSPFSQTGWSNYFDGTGDYLATPANAAFNVGTSSFTLEAWIYPTNFSSTRALFSFADSNVFYFNTSGIPVYGIFGTSDTTIGSTAVSVNTWTHVAFVRSGSTLTCYLNGVSAGSITTSSSIGNSTSGNSVGQHRTGNYFFGYISNLRLVNGAAIYTSGFTPSTSPLTTTSQGASASQVELLTCQSNRFIDNSDNAFALTAFADVSVQAFSPFAPTAAYSAATVGGSGYFDGTGDYLSSATSTDLQLGSSDFSLEWWEYRTVLSNVDTAIVCGDGTFNAQLAYYNTGFPRFYLSTTGSSWNVFSDAATGAIAANSWNHFVLTRSGTAFRVFLNGVLSIYATGSGSVTQSTNQIFISGGINGNSLPIEGYISGVRFVKGSIPTSYQTSSTTTNTSIFTPPTAPVTTTSQGATSGDVKYLVNFTNAGVVDSTAKNVLETVGNAQISTTQSKFGGSSMYFDGNGDGLYFPTNIPFISTGDFTVEGWFYPASTANQTLISLNSSATTGFAAMRLDFEGSTGKLFLLCSANNSTWAVNVGTTNTISLNTWAYFAVVRSGSSFTVYINGTSGATATLSGVLYAGTASYVGCHFSTSVLAQPVNGYLDDIRVTRYARTITASPTAAFPLQ